uniref:DNA-(apurinic or apyrimidinic site) lyase n=1 Tax=Alexandrium monilatum TaxID=311494 RepID=A0A6T0YEV3_9DINO
MVEGDGCHRVAAEHRKTLVGRKLKATSPNRRFRAGALAINKAGGVLVKIEVHGKNLFYFFGPDATRAMLVVHIHFGMAGAFAVYTGKEPETTANTRLRLTTADGSGPELAAHLSAMTVEHGRPEKLYAELAEKLGPDPLRADADVKKFQERCKTSKKPIGTMLMDQSAIAGVGNIYRSEVLYEAGVHPCQPANTLSSAELAGLWCTIVTHMQSGFRTGSIWGDREEALVYGRDQSACGGSVTSMEMGGRTVYTCATKQILDEARQPVAPPKGLVRSGTEHIKDVVPASVSEGRKRRTGEGLGVQHVALKDDATRAEALAWARERRQAAAAGRASAAKRKVSAKASQPRQRTAARKRPATGSRVQTRKRPAAAAGGRQQKLRKRPAALGA